MPHPQEFSQYLLEDKIKSLKRKLRETRQQLQDKEHGVYITKIEEKATNYAACIIRFMLDEKGSLLRISGWRRTMGFIGYIRFLYKGVSLKRGPLFAPSHLSVNVAARSCQKI